MIQRQQLRIPGLEYRWDIDSKKVRSRKACLKSQIQNPKSHVTIGMCILEFFSAFLTPDSRLFHWHNIRLSNFKYCHDKALI